MLREHDGLQVAESLREGLDRRRECPGLWIHHARFFRGRPPSFPFARTAASFAADLERPPTLPPLRPDTVKSCLRFRGMDGSVTRKTKMVLDRNLKGMGH